MDTPQVKPKFEKGQTVYRTGHNAYNGPKLGEKVTVESCGDGQLADLYLREYPRSGPFAACRFAPEAPMAVPASHTFEDAAKELGSKLPEGDAVLLPPHYARFKIEPIHFIVENGIGFMAGNVIKYVCRHDAKNGVEDLKKARRYLDMLIAKAENRSDWSTKESSARA